MMFSMVVVWVPLLGTASGVQQWLLAGVKREDAQPITTRRLAGFVIGWPLGP